MKLNFNQSFKDFKGKEIGVTIADEIGKLLFGISTSNNTPLSADEKYMAYKLCSKMACEGEVELNAGESAFVVKICGEYFSAGAYGQVKDLIEG